jgi:hypothetical protein
LTRPFEALKKRLFRIILLAAERLVNMKTTAEIGLKITAAQREFYHYTGVSAELEKHGAGSSPPELTWVRRSKQESPATPVPVREQPSAPQRS